MTVYVPFQLYFVLVPLLDPIGHVLVSIAEVRIAGRGVQEPLKVTTHIHSENVPDAFTWWDYLRQLPGGIT